MVKNFMHHSEQIEKMSYLSKVILIAVYVQCAKHNSRVISLKPSAILSFLYRENLIDKISISKVDKAIKEIMVLFKGFKHV